MEVNLKGLHRVKKKLADGSTATYYYAYRGGPRVEAPFGTPEFVAEFVGLKPKSPPKVKPNSLNWLITQYIRSRSFQELSDASRKEYQRYLGQIGQKFGNAPLAVATRPDAITEYRKWHRSMEDTPRAANYALAVLKRLMSWAIESGNAITNPTTDITPLKQKSTRRDVIWSDEQIVAFENAAPVHVWNPFRMALLTSQRKKDILEMVWTSYDGETIKLIQSKTGKEVWIKASDELRQMLDTLPRRANQIFLNSRGQPWTLDGYDSSWGDARKDAGVKGVTFHDTRGTAITNAYIGGATFREISLMSGHKEAEVEEIINRHYLNRTAAAAAIDAMKSVNQAK